MTERPSREFIQRVEKALIDEGLIIEAGWESLRLMGYPDVSEGQRKVLRTVFFAGAKHLFDSIMSALDPDAEPTADDMRRMSLINDELNRFIVDYLATHPLTEGHA